MTGINTVLCDLDGTIIDTTALILASFHYALAQRGEQSDDQALLAHFGRTLTESLQQLRPHWGQEEINQTIAHYLEHNEREHDAWVTIIPGADAVLRTLHQQGMKLGVVTSKREQMANRGLELVGLGDLFGVLVHSSSAPRPKPDPAPVLLALRQLASVPEQTVLVGDSPYDMTAARRAGCHAVGLVHNTFGAADLLRAGAERVMTGWSEFLSVVDELSTRSDTVDR